MKDLLGSSKYTYKKQTYNEYLSKQKALYIAKSKKVEANIKEYKQKIKMINKMTNEKITLKHDFMQVSKDNYLWFVYNQKLLEEKMITEGGYVALFLTLTLPSSFHQYSKTKKRLNSLFVEGNTIKKGYEVLNQSFREIYKNFKGTSKNTPKII